MGLPFTEICLRRAEMRLLKRICKGGDDGIACESEDGLDRLISLRLVVWIHGSYYGAEPRGVDYLAYRRDHARRVMWQVIGAVVPIVISLISLAKSFEAEIKSLLT